MAVVVITDSNLGDGSTERRELAQHEVRLLDARSAADIVVGAADAEGVLVQWQQLDAATIAALPRLRAIVRYGIGLDNVDIAAAQQRGVAVANVPDYCVDEVAAHTVALVLAHSRRLRPLAEVVRDGGWTVDGVEAPFAPSEDPVGVAGLGRIGSAVATQLRALGHPVLGWDPFATAWPADVDRVDSLLELARASHHLTLHIPLTEDTTAAVGADVLAALGPGGHLVNTSRGGLIDESALLAAVSSGALGRASLDVLTREPPTGETLAALVGHPRVDVTPHAAYYSSASKQRLQLRAAQIMNELLA